MTGLPAPMPRRRRRDWLGNWPLLPAVAFTAIFLVYPVLQLLALSLQNPDGSFTLEQFARIFRSPVYLSVLWNSIYTAAVSTVLCLVCAYPIAYLLSTIGPTTRGALLVWILVPLRTSFLVRAVAWIILLTGQGLINNTLLALGVIDQPLRLLNNFTGLLIGTVHGLTPIAVMLLLSVMTTIDPRLTSAATTLGARGANRFWQVYFPLTAPGLVSAGLIVFINALGLFVASQFLGGARDIMISQLIIQQVEQVFDLNFAGALGVLLLAATLVAVWLFDRVLGLSVLTGTPDTGRRAERRGGRRSGVRILDAVGGAGARLGEAFDRFLPRIDLGGRRPVLWAVCTVLIIFIAAPTFILIPASFSDGEFLSWPPRGFSLRWYETFFNDPLWRDALLRSTIVAFATAVFSMLIGVPAAYVLLRRKVRGGSLILGIILLPLVLPGIIIAVGLFYLYARVGLLQTYAGLILGHSVFALPYVLVTSMAILRTYDQRLDQAAWTLGAGKLTTFRLVALPLMRAGMASAFLFAFVQSFDELSVSLLVSSPSAPTLSKQLWVQALYKSDPSLAAASTTMILIVAVPIILSQGYLLLARRRRASRSL